MDLPKFEKFELRKKIGHRLCFTAYEAQDLRTGSQVTLKVLDPLLSTNENHVVNFLGGARIIKHLNHPNIFRVFDLGKDPTKGHYYIAEESTNFKPLSNLALEKSQLSPQDLFEILLITGKTLRYAHLHGLVHGFLNPNSLFIKPDGAIKIADFGFNWFIPLLLKESNKQSLYCAQYISPEYYKEITNVDGRGDIYSLGLVLYEILQGKHPFKAESISTIQNHHLSSQLPPLDLHSLGMPQDFANVIRDSVNKNRELRYQNLKEYLGALEKIKTETFSGEDTQPVKNEEIDLALHSEQSEKYFDDVAFLEKQSANKKEETQKQRRPLNKPKLAFSGAGALFLVILILFVTNYIPLPFGKHGPATLEDSAQDESVALAGPVPSNENTAPVVAKKSEVKPSTPKTTLVSKPSPANDIRPKKKVVKPPRRDQRKSATTRSKVPKKVVKATKLPGPKRSEVTDPRLGPAETSTATVDFYVKSNNRPTQANVFLDNSFIGKTDRKGTLEVNGLDIGRTFSVKISKEGYTSTAQEFVVAANMPAIVFDIESKKAVFGTVIIDAVPTADKVFVDGKLQQKPTPVRVSLKYGKHKIRLVNSKLGLVYEEEIDLKIGQILRLRHDFTQEEIGYIAVSLKNAAQYGFGYVYVDGQLWHQKHNTTPLQIKLPVGSHTVEIRRDGFSSIPRDVIVEVEKGETKYVAFTLNKEQ